MYLFKISNRLKLYPTTSLIEFSSVQRRSALVWYIKVLLALILLIETCMFFFFFVTANIISSANNTNSSQQSRRTHTPIASV